MENIHAFVMIRLMRPQGVGANYESALSSKEFILDSYQYYRKIIEYPKISYSYVTVVEIIIQLLLNVDVKLLLKPCFSDSTLHEAVPNGSTTNH